MGDLELEASSSWQYLALKLEVVQKNKTLHGAKPEMGTHADDDDDEDDNAGWMVVCSCSERPTCVCSSVLVGKSDLV